MPTTSPEVRARLIDALRLDLIGPRPAHPAHEVYAEELLPVAPSKWYLTGFLVPYEAHESQRADPEGDDTVDAAGEVGADDDETPEANAARKVYFPSSIGLSVLVPATTSRLRVRARWGDYLPASRDDEEAEALPGSPAPEERGGRGQWRRHPREAETEVLLRAGTPDPLDLPGHPGLRLVVSVRTLRESKLVPSGTQAVSIFLVNERAPAADHQRDRAYAFQPELEVTSEAPFVPRPDLHGRDSDDWDEQVADLQYRDVMEYAVGHNVSVVAHRDARGGCKRVATEWMPTAEVEKVQPGLLPDVQLGMEALADAPTPEALRVMIAPMLTAYADWIAKQTAASIPDGKRREMAYELLKNAERARGRIGAGLDAMRDPQVFEAFRIANRAIAAAIRQRACHDDATRTPESIAPPQWYPFQLAFLLMNIVGVASPEHPDRRVVDLLFFPTGGGKTEAYLGLAAFTLALRRLRDPSVHSAGLSVLMRYTLRLLTLDQLGRAATLICALELIRQQDVEKLGRWPFEIGLWVGQSATPNRMGRKGDNNPNSARARTIAFLNDTGRRPSPIPLENCPWCGWKFTKDSFKLLPNADQPTDLRVMCVNRKCAFHQRAQPRGFPILSVDDAIYRRLPAFLIATVDKFASLPWVGETAGLFGRVERHDDAGFYGPSHPNAGGHRLERALPPPDLVIQDELHLISGPLGTMVGLYEAAIDALASQQPGGAGPKIVASTATVRRAQRQIRALFGRTEVEVFPPPGHDRRDAFFAKTVPARETPARLYLAVAAQGRNLKVVLLRTYLALMGAAQLAWKDADGAKNPANPADPYMTLLGYFNALRELGGSRRIVEDEVTSRLTDLGSRRRRINDPAPLFANRPRVQEPLELTSRVSTGEVSSTKRRLSLGFHEKDRVDVALATNMISVGLDITRLGLMVVLGQPKSASEYIQATSRVGRDAKRPGLVVTLLNVHRPRDRSHYERFAAWHESFYRSVEATSVTPFSPRAVDRGLAGVTVALARLGHRAMTPPAGASLIDAHRAELAFVADTLADRAQLHDANLDAAEAEATRVRVRDRVNGLLDAWSEVARMRGRVQYQREEGELPPLLFDPLDPELSRQPRVAWQFRANRSLRDVEPSVSLWLRAPDGSLPQEEGE